MSKIKNIAVFLAGAICGSIVVWQLTKKRYEQLTQEEIASVKETFAKRSIGICVNPEELREKEEEYCTNDISATKTTSNYLKAENKQQETKMQNAEPEHISGKTRQTSVRPYVISPDDFGEFEQYDRISLTYYADHILADDNDKPIDDIDNVVGIESLTHFGEYEDDSVFVRNDAFKCDYEILLDERTYSEVLKTKPHWKEV